MTLDTTQILLIALAVTFVEKWAFIVLYLRGQRAQTFPSAAGPVVTTPPVVIPPVAVGRSKVLRGKCSWFGGPNDHGVKPEESLALVERSDFGHGNWGGIFLPTQPAGTTGLARALNPDAHYLACRWDYNETSKKYLQGIKVTVKNPANGKTATDVRPVDWGPNENTGRVADISPGLMAFLGLNTDDLVEVDVPLPSLGPTQPAGPVTPTAPTSPVASGLIPGIDHVSWPAQSQASSFFGAPGTNLVKVACPWELTVEGTKTHSITINAKCAASLTQILNAIWEQCGKSQSQIDAFGYNIFDGSFAERDIRGGSGPSQHSWAAALDFNAAANPQHAPLSKTKFQENSLIVKAFKQAGWTWGGDWTPKSIDAMHFQALHT